MASTTDQKPNEQLERRDVEAVTKMAGSLIRTPLELAERVRALQQVAHVLTPAVAVASIPAHIAINPVVVVIDLAIDASTGRGNDLYFQRSIHKSNKHGRGYDATYEPLEASLNKNAILRVLASSGVKLTSSRRTDDGSKPNYWSWESRGEIREFDGSWRPLPPGNVEIDLRDGSAQIGEWTKEAWAQAEAAVEKRKAVTPKEDQWKVKPEPIGGWSQERVIGARKFGLRLAEAKSLTALGRNLGLKQIYSLEELKKPFVIFRAMWQPDMSDPETRRMVTAAELGATHLLGYPSGPALPAAGATDQTPSTVQTTHAGADIVDGEISDAGGKSTSESVNEDRPFAPASGAQATTDLEPTYHVASVIRRKAGSASAFLITTKETGEGQGLLTNDEAIATAAHEAGQAGRALHLDLEKRSNGEVWLLALEPEQKL